MSPTTCPVQASSASSASSTCDDPGPGVTPAQYRVLAAWARNSSLKEAARDCGISVCTAKRHVLDAYARMGASSNLEAFRALGWLVPPEAAA
jgi:DNA-binding CsgD family transcriptional regulator